MHLGYLLRNQKWKVFCLSALSCDFQCNFNVIFNENFLFIDSLFQWDKCEERVERGISMN